MSKLYDYSKENLEKIVKESWCLDDAMYKLAGKKTKAHTLRKYLDFYNIDTSHWKTRLPELSKDEEVTPKTKLQRQILELRKQGKTFREIADELKCAKSSVSYTLRGIQRQKVKKRKDKYPEWFIKFIRNISNFNHEKSHIYIRPINEDWKMKLRSATNKFIKRGGYMTHFGYKDVLKKYNNSYIIQCYLTGDTIDITKDDYACDHIIPISRGGSCDLSNFAIVPREVNQAKSDLTEDEFVDLCKKVLIHHGYSVEKND